MLCDSTSDILGLKNQKDAPVHTFYYGNRFNENLMFNRSHTVQHISFNTTSTVKLVNSGKKNNK